MSRPPIRVMCVDDYPMILEGLAAMIGRQPDMQVVAVASSGDRAVEQYQAHRPDVTLMDLQLPVMSAHDAIRSIRRGDPDARIVVLAMGQADEDVQRALQAGAAACLPKEVPGDELLQTIRLVHDRARPQRLHVPPLPAWRQRPSLLTPREQQVLELMASGRRNREIGAELGISIATTKVHVKNVLAKLDVNDRTAAVYLALQRGIIHL